MADPLRRIALIEGHWDPNEAIGDFAKDAAGPAGAIASFVGKVRGTDGVEALELKHYPAMTLPGMEALADTVLTRWSLHGLLIQHRVGTMQPGEPIVAVSAAAAHRRAAFEAVDFAMDHLKSDAWFWKREKTAGAWRWIEPTAADHADRARW